MYRVDLEGKGQAVDGDLTTTGAVCIATGFGHTCDGRNVLRVGDPTTACPVCGEAGTVVDGYTGFISDGQYVAWDGSLVACACPTGSNRVVAPLGGWSPTQAASSTMVARQATSAGATDQPSPAGFVSSTTSGVLQPGFHIVRRSMSGPQLLSELLSHDSTLPISYLRRLNPTFDQGFKAGEIFVIGDPDNQHACTREEADLMAAAARARQALEILDEQEANFMMEYIGEIAGVLSNASLSMGVGKDMLARGLGQVEDTLKGIERLHQREFIANRRMNSKAFHESRKALYQQLQAQLRSAFLDKYLNLGRHDDLRRGLGISTKSLVHHWSKAGAPGAIPGYATHLDEVARTARYLKYGGYVGIGLGAGASSLKIYEACRAGVTEECKKIRLTETGSFSGGLVGGAYGARGGVYVASIACGPVGAATAVIGGAVCGVVLVGAGSLIGAMGGSFGGEYVGEVLYEWQAE